MKEQQDYAPLLAWNFTPESIKHGTRFQERGERFIVPISGPNTVDFCQPNPVALASKQFNFASRSFVLAGTGCFPGKVSA